MGDNNYVRGLRSSIDSQRASLIRYDLTGPAPYIPYSTKSAVQDTRKPRATIHGETVAAFIDTLTADEVLDAGGKIRKGGRKLLVASQDFTVEPAKFDAVSVWGENYEVISIMEIHPGVLQLICGDVLSTDRKTSLIQ